MRTSKSGLSLLAAMPRERVITETDGPFVQLGGKPCTPKDVKSATQLLSNAWGIPFVETANAVLDNFLKLIA
jgi:TatD DNase family protein